MATATANNAMISFGFILISSFNLFTTNSFSLDHRPRHHDRLLVPFVAEKEELLLQNNKRTYKRKIKVMAII